jgi:cytoskeleton protein RodZ
MRTGNAGALEIAIDGKPVPPIGGIGMLRRDVALDPTELAGGTAVHG